MELEDPRPSFFSSIAIDKCHINLSPHKVFLFGGKMDGDIKTVRSLLYNHILCKNQTLFNSLVIVEEFKDWLHDSIYPDLLTFESDLAETASLVVISLESAGAIAELGSFSVNSKLKDKTVIVICDEHHNQDSYIKLGPLRQLKDENILSYPYQYQDLEESLTEHLEDIVDTLVEKLDKNDKSEKFNPHNNGHIAFLIHDLILTCKVLILKEIKLYLKTLGIDRNAHEIQRLIFLLRKLDLIKEERRGHTTYYVLADNKATKRVSFSSEDETIIDRSSATMASIRYYHTAKKEKRRLNVLATLVSEAE